MNALKFPLLNTDTDTLKEVPDLLAEYADTSYLTSSITQVQTKAEAAYFLHSLSEYLSGADTVQKHLDEFLGGVDYGEGGTDIEPLELMREGLESRKPPNLYEDLGNIIEIITDDIGYRPIIALAAIGTFTRKGKPNARSGEYRLTQQDELLIRDARLGKVSAINRIIEQLNCGVSL